ncbi:hypothetical protein Mapa_012267 [Marchantia paleacea]|nr:hypothetical protein Mapa_012267 [Marchantia paleacea]
MCNKLNFARRLAGRSEVPWLLTYIWPLGGDNVDQTVTSILVDSKWSANAFQVEVILCRVDPRIISHATIVWAFCNHYNTLGE